jgi:protocatechuate 3,4-dioxygenase beta subunit
MLSYYFYYKTLFILLLTFSSQLQAQTFTVSGEVVDVNGRPIEEAIIFTDLGGEYVFCNRNNRQA